MLSYYYNNIVSKNKLTNKSFDIKYKNFIELEVKILSNLTHLDKLEAEAIHIMREVAAECEKPVMLYSIGKDSSVMLHLALKAFYPEKPPFPFYM